MKVLSPQEAMLADLARSGLDKSDAPPPETAIHEMGGARMGLDPKTSVLNDHTQAHDVPNLCVRMARAWTPRPARTRPLPIRL